MWQRLACDDEKACLMQPEYGFSIARWKDLGTYHLILPNNTIDVGTKENIPACGRHPAKPGPRPLSNNQVLAYDSYRCNTSVVTNIEPIGCGVPVSGRHIKVLGNIDNECIVTRHIQP